MYYRYADGLLYVTVLNSTFYVIYRLTNNGVFNEYSRSRYFFTKRVTRTNGTDTFE